MTVLRSDIERALDDIISNEDGMKFQGLAVVLAKKRWPDLIACERKKDMGADALAKAPFAAEGKGMVLACSTTATLEKIRSDAEKIKAHFPKGYGFAHLPVWLAVVSATDPNTGTGWTAIRDQ